MGLQHDLDAAARQPPWRTHWPLALVLLLAAALLFTNLQRGYLWADEGDTAVLARNILKFGVPTAWDGVTFTDSDYGARLNDDLVMVRHPLLQYYLTAGSFALFGDTRFGARFPFAMLALGTVLIVYILVFQAARDRRAALASAALLTLSVQFMLYGRQSRYYAAAAFLSCLLVFLFLRLRSWRSAMGFGAAAVLAFHAHPVAIAPVAGVGVLALFHAPLSEQRRWFWRVAPMIALAVVPWLMMSMSGYVDRLSGSRDAVTYLSRFLQFMVETASVTPVVGGLVLAWVLHRRGRRQPAAPRRPSHRHAAPGRGDDTLLRVLVAGILSFAIAVTLTQTRDAIWSAGLRYSAGVIPFVMMATGILIARVSAGRWLPFVALFLVLGFSKAGRLTPLTFWADSTPLRHLDSFVTFHNPERAVDRILRTGQVAFVGSLFRQQSGTVREVAEFLARQAGRDDIVITNYEWEPLYFHTGLPQGLKVLPSDPVWHTAQSHALPRYVFSTQGVRWVVWRRAWGAYRGHDIEAILRRIADQGARVTPVHEVAETMWENRENVHFRRFPGRRYLYSWFDDLPSAVIFRVDWPAAGGGPPSAADGMP